MFFLCTQGQLAFSLLSTLYFFLSQYVCLLVSFSNSILSVFSYFLFFLSISSFFFFRSISPSFSLFAFLCLYLSLFAYMSATAPLCIFCLCLPLFLSCCSLVYLSMHLTIHFLLPSSQSCLSLDYYVCQLIFLFVFDPSCLSRLSMLTIYLSNLAVSLDAQCMHLFISVCVSSTYPHSCPSTYSYTFFLQLLCPLYVSCISSCLEIESKSILIRV